MQLFRVSYLAQESGVTTMQNAYIAADDYSHAASLCCGAFYEWDFEYMRVSGRIDSPGFFQPVSANPDHHPFYLDSLGEFVTHE